MVSGICIGRDRMERKVLRNEEVNELRGQNAVSVVFKEVVVSTNGSRSKTEMRNLMSLVLQSSVDKGSDQKIRMMTATSTSTRRYCLMA